MTVKITFLDRDTIASYVTLRAPSFQHQWINFGNTVKNQVVERLHGCEIAVVNKVVLGKEQLQQLPQLKMIAVAATGTNIIDLEYCSQRGIAVANIRNYAMHSVPEHALGLMLALRRNIFAYHQDVRSGAWQQSKQFCFFNHNIRDLAGSRLGIIGAGALGQAMAELGRGLGMDVVFAERKGKVSNEGECVAGNFLPFDSVISTSDVISLHCPLTSETKNLMDVKVLKQMKNTALLINTARGGIVNEHDLARALEEGIIAGAGFDVLSDEPPSDNNPLLALMDLPNFILTPHVAWASQQSMQTLADQLIDNIEAFVLDR
jgi:glycerate dehydrogenase